MAGKSRVTPAGDWRKAAGGTQILLMRRAIGIWLGGFLAACGGVSPAGPAAYVVVRPPSGGSWIARYDGLPSASGAQSPIAAGDVTAFAARDPSNGHVYWVHAGNRPGYPGTRWQVDELDADLGVVRSRPDSDVLGRSGVSATAAEGPGILLSDARLLVFTAIGASPKATPGLLVVDVSTFSEIAFLPTAGVFGDPVPGPVADEMYVLGASPSSSTGQRIFDVDARHGIIRDSALAGPGQALIATATRALYLLSSDSIRIIDPSNGSALVGAATGYAGPATLVPTRAWLVRAGASGAGGSGAGAEVRDAASLGVVAHLMVLPDTIIAGAASIAADASGRYLFVTSAPSGAPSASYLTVVDLDSKSIRSVARLPGNGMLLAEQP